MTNRTIWKSALVSVAAAALMAVGTGCGASGDLAAYEAFDKQAGAPTVRVPLVTAPKIDGVLDDVYAKAEPLKFRFLAGGATKPTAHTTVYLVSTRQELVVFFECKTSDPSVLVADNTGRDVGIWGDDYVELFLNPGGTRTGTFWQVGVNPAEAIWDGTAAVSAGEGSWNPDLKVKVKKLKDAWNVEISIPFSDLTAGKINKVWVGNFGRMAQLEGEDISWCATNSSQSFIPEKFGYLWLEVGTVDNTK